MLGRPALLGGNRVAATFAARGSFAVDADVELENTRRSRHACSVTASSGSSPTVRAHGRAAQDAQRGRVLRALLRVAVDRGLREVLRRDPDPRLEPSEMGERLRRLLELRLDAREPEAA